MVTLRRGQLLGDREAINSAVLLDRDVIAVRRELLFQVVKEAPFPQSVLGKRVDDHVHG